MIILDEHFKRDNIITTHILLVLKFTHLAHLMLRLILYKSPYVSFLYFALIEFLIGISRMHKALFLLF